VSVVNLDDLKLKMLNTHLEHLDKEQREVKKDMDMLFDKYNDLTISIVRAQMEVDAIVHRGNQ